MLFILHFDWFWYDYNNSFKPFLLGPNRERPQKSWFNTSNDYNYFRMPITVYMYDQKSGGLISIAEYGQEFGKDNPIEILYHGFGHYDALHIPGQRGARSRLWDSHENLVTGWISRPAKAKKFRLIGETWRRLHTVICKFISII